VYYEADDAVTLIDPLLPRGLEDDFLAALDRDVARLDRPVAVLLTAPWHKRDAASVAERYGTTVWAHPAAQARLTFATQAGTLPNGVETFSACGVAEGDVVFYLRPHRALVVAEVFMGIGGALRVCPSPALQDRAAFERSLQTLLSWPIDHVLVAHGEPMIGNIELPPMPAQPASAATARIATDPIEIIMPREAGRISIGPRASCSSLRPSRL
jgi:glyoxylase-like metal-dependent hydrolase (beta-lactamase superfamily II)